MFYVAYLDEFGHIGPYVNRHDQRYHDSPVFGLAGFVLPLSEIRSFGTWFYQRKCDLLNFEIERSGKHPALWEKKGSTLFTVRNIEKYPGLRLTTNRLINKIKERGGFLFYVGLQKNKPPEEHTPNAVYQSVLAESIKRLDQFCQQDCQTPSSFLLVMDEHDQRSGLVTAATRSMYNPDEPRRALIEPPFQAESHRYQTLQAADWIAGLIGRLGAFRVKPDLYPEYEVFDRYFGQRVARCQWRSSIRP